MPIGVEVFGENLRQYGVAALPHFGLRYAEQRAIVGRDGNPVGQLVLARRAAAASCQRNGHNERGARGKRRCDEIVPRERHDPA